MNCLRSAAIIPNGHGDSNMNDIEHSNGNPREHKTNAIV